MRKHSAMINSQTSIFVNGLNSKSGGGKSILKNFCYHLNSKKLKNTFYILVPKRKDYKECNNPKIKIFSFPRIFTSQLFLPIHFLIIIPSVIFITKSKRVLNFSDIPIKTNAKQIFLFDWAYAVYPEIEIWNSMSFIEKFKRSFKIYYFKKLIDYVDIVIAQTETIKKRLIKQYNINRVVIIPNSVAFQNLNIKKNYNFNLTSNLNFICLTRYYIHKNLECFVPLGQLIASKKLNIKIILTIDKNEHPLARKLLREIKKKNLEEVIVNIGPVSMEKVPSLYQQCSALILPTLLESFSGTYVEAMFHKKPIFTSDLDFAHDVCANNAIYFNPFDPNDIFEKILFIEKDKKMINEKISGASQLLKEIPSWGDNFISIMKVLSE